ncbi:NADP-dependent oxidoreductase domain-containing protein, partial [Suillus occidentalis]
PANLRRSVELINEKLHSTKHLDLFQSARVDPNVSLEDSIKALVELKNEGKLDHIGMSECSPFSMLQVHPIAAVEIEVSPWAYKEETENVIATAKELGIAVIAYSPLGHRVLTGQIKRLEDILGGDVRRSLPRFQEDNFAIVDALTAIARSKNVTSAQLSIAWVASLGKHVIPLPGSSWVTRTWENSVGGDIKLSTEDIAEIKSVISAADVKGDRFGHQAYLWG